MDLPILLPRPRQLHMLGGFFRIPDDRLVMLDDPHPHMLVAAGKRVISALQAELGIGWELQAGWALPTDQVGLRLSLAPEMVPQPQGYRLEIAQRGIQLLAHDPAGAFYGTCTLVQLIQTCGRDLSCLNIEDWPDFPRRGVMLDISRDKVPTMQTIFQIVDMLAGWKINQLQLYTENAFAYRQHPDVWRDVSPMTAQEVMDLDIYCRERFIELVPNQNTFGHMRHWLKLPAYQHLAELTGRFISPWGEMEGPYSLCPVDPGSLELVKSLFDELLPNFTSRQLNVGCDETIDVGQGRSREACERIGRGQVYLDFLLKIYQEVKRRGFRMQFWADIIVDFPELLGSLPADAIAMEWGYEADHPFDAHLATFASTGLATYACGGTSAWNSLAGRTQNALDNLKNAAKNGLKHGSVGLLNTDWGDNGHWQVLPVSYLGYAAGAAYSWGLEANRDLDLPLALDSFAFRDKEGVLGRMAYELGNLYLRTGVILHNSTSLFHALHLSMADLRKEPWLAEAKFDAPLDALDQASFELTHAIPGTSDNALVLREFGLTIRWLRHACQRGFLAQNPAEANPDKLQEMRAELDELVQEYQAIWLQRNRPGGLRDSLSHFEAPRKDYLDL